MSKTKTSAAPKSGPAVVSKHQAFTMERLHRSKLVTAAYNPRVITDDAKSKLKKNLKKVGLLEPLIWNRKTGTLLGGHQRLACLDALEGSPDYLLDVAVVELSEREEKEQNIALNNLNLQGEYDTDLLAQLLKTPDLELDATGLDLADIQVMFDDPELATLFVPNEPSAKALDDVAKQQAAAKTKERLQKERAEDKPVYDEREDTETYAVLVFKTREERAAFAGHLGYTDQDKYLDGARAMEKLNAAMLPTTGKVKPAAPASPAPAAATPAAAPAPKAGRSSKKGSAPSGAASKSAP